MTHTFNRIVAIRGEASPTEIISIGGPVPSRLGTTPELSER
jgi:hypothetical protein